MRPTAPFVFVLLLAACVAEPPPEPTTGRAAPIVNGAPEPGYDSVVGIMTGPRDSPVGHCTGTLIGPHAVLTAKHCVFRQVGFDRYEPMMPGILWVAVSSNISVAGENVRKSADVYEVRTTPGNYRRAQLDTGEDLAVLILTRDLGERPHGIRSRPPARGNRLTIVGFGRQLVGTPRPSDFGHKHRGEVEVSSVRNGIFTTDGEQWICQGDSGGPAFDADGDVAGVASYGVGRDCRHTLGGYTEVSQHRQLIEDALAVVPPCEPETEICNGVDDDCDGVRDQGCYPPGHECEDPAQCTSGRCEMFGDTRVCTDDCDPRVRDVCGEGLVCEATGCDVGRCVPVGGTLEAGALCEVDAECASGRCATVGEDRRCGVACGLEGEPCPDGALCASENGTCGTCLPPEMVVTLRVFGDPCEADADCHSGVCWGGMCSRSCADEACPEGSHCREGRCAPGPLGGRGDACVHDDDCGDDAPTCLQDGESVCAFECNHLGNCPEGYACQSTEAGERCLPEGRPLGQACEADEDCRSGLCDGACTLACEAELDCPPGFLCQAGAEGESTCRPAPSEGGCSSAGGGGGSALPSLLWLAALLLVWRAARQRACCGTPKT